MKRIIPVLIVSSFLSNCVTVTQNANQAVNAQLPAGPTLAAPTFGTAPANPVQPDSLSTSPHGAPASVVPASPAPASPASPAAPVPVVKGEFTLFETTIPHPEAVAAYSAADIDQALVAWKNRYEKAKSHPYEVLKMYMDAYLLAHKNAPLARKLLAVLVTKDTSGSDLDFFVQRAAADPGGRNTFFSYYRGTSPAEGFTLQDFPNRKLNLVNNDPAALEKEIADPNSLTPPNPKSGDHLDYWLQTSSPTKGPRKVEMVFSASQTWEVKATSTITLGVS